MAFRFLSKSTNGYLKVPKSKVLSSLAHGNRIVHNVFDEGRGKPGDRVLLPGLFDASVDLALDKPLPQWRILCFDARLIRPNRHRVVARFPFPA